MMNYFTGSDIHLFVINILYLFSKYILFWYYITYNEVNFFANVQIVVLENGKVVEQGPHEVLLANAGRYAQLWGQQNNTVDAIDTAIKLGA